MRKACANASIAPCAGKCAAPIPIGSHLSGGLDCSSVSVLAARALAEKGERLAAYTQVPRAGFDGPVADGCYADETPYVEAIRQLTGNIDVTYILNDECDDFADLERCFLALEGPVRNPLTLGWMLAIPRAARAQGRRVLLGGLFGNSTISWNGWSQTVDHLLAGRLITAYQQWRLYYRARPIRRWSAFHRLIIEAIARGPTGPARTFDGVAPRPGAIIRDPCGFCRRQGS